MRLTLKELHAISEALAFRTAGEMDDIEESAAIAYESAHSKVVNEIAHREQVQRVRESTQRLTNILNVR